MSRVSPRRSDRSRRNVGLVPRYIGAARAKSTIPVEIGLIRTQIRPIATKIAAIARQVLTIGAKVTRITAEIGPVPTQISPVPCNVGAASAGPPVAI
jgi:hypothetical protein